MKDSSITTTKNIENTSPPRQSTRSQGTYFESLAEKYLQYQGLETITKNFRKKLGEIDLILSQGQNIIFVEVKFRRNSDFGTPLESINKDKIRRIHQVSLLFLKEHPKFRRLNMRFDVVSIIPREGVAQKVNELVARNKQIPGAFNINWIQAAF